MGAVATPPRTFTREDIVRLGRTGRAWEFLPVGMRALEVAPEDAGVRLLVAANAAGLGLRTLARELIEAVPAELASHRDAAALGAQLDRLPDDEVDAACRRARVARAVEVLRERGVELGEALEAWTRRDAGCRWFRAGDGNVVRRRDGRWEGFADHLGAARRFAAQNFGPREGRPARPVTVEGINPPWLLLEIAAATPRAADGHQARLAIVQAAPMELLDGLAHADLAGLLAEARVSVFVGDDASAALAQDLRDRFESQIVGPCVPLATTGRRAEPSVEDVLRRADADQAVEHRRLKAAIDARYAPRDRAWWAERYARSRRGGGPPLRVLVPTCRYSTYIRHASRDLVAALRDAGLEAELLIEPDDHSRFSSLAYLRAIDRLDPDLVILINYTRAHLGELFPARLPFVCWMQDAMGHHYDAGIGARQTDLDFLVGHLPQELFEQFGYPRERCLEMPVVASPRTFHATPVDDDARRRFECEIAWVSHHSETPEAMHERLKGEIGAELAPVLERLRPEVERVARSPLDGPTGARLRDATVAAAGGRADGRVVTHLFRLYAKPMADRVLRHEALGWAEEIAARRGWRLRVHGRGWDAHPRFGEYAGGELAHDDELRACYQCAAVHLHMTISNVVHQRIMECALSGGLPLCRLNNETVGPLEGAMKIAAVAAEPVGADGDAVAFSTSGSEDARVLAGHLRRLGREVPDVIRVPAAAVERLRAKASPLERRADWLLGDLSETTFSSAEELEGLIERAIVDAAWRRETSEGIAARVRERLTDDALVRRVLDLVASSLGDPA